MNDLLPMACAVLPAMSVSALLIGLDAPVRNALRAGGLTYA